MQYLGDQFYLLVISSISDFIFWQENPSAAAAYTLRPSIKTIQARGEGSILLLLMITYYVLTMSNE